MWDIVFFSANKIIKQVPKTGNNVKKDGKGVNWLNTKIGIRIKNKPNDDAIFFMKRLYDFREIIAHIDPAKSSHILVGIK